MDPARAGYLAAIEQLFVELRGRGFLLSPRDVLLVDTWRERGIPLHVVLTAIGGGVERFRSTRAPGTPIPSTLAYFASHVEQAMVDRRELLVDDAAAPAPVAADAEEAGRKAMLGALVEAGRSQGSESAKEVLRLAWRRLVRHGDEDVWSLTARVDGDIVEMLAATLTAAEREALDASAAAVVSDAGGARMSEQARADVHRAAWERLVRERFGVPDLVEVLVAKSM